MGKFSGYMICSDCDGTLTNSNREISKENADAIKYFQDNGGLFTVATGRYPNYIEEFKDAVIPNAYVIGCNGTVIFDLTKQEVVHSVPMEFDNLPILKYVFEELPSVFEVIASSPTHEIYHYLRADFVPENEYEEEYKNTPRVKSYGDIEKIHGNQTINRFLFVQDEKFTVENQRILRHKFGDEYKFVQSFSMGLEVQAAESGKGELILELKKILPQIHTTIGVGDNENDVSMLELCDIGYAVSNARDEVKKHAKKITVSCDESAIAKIIEDILYCV